MIWKYRTEQDKEHVENYLKNNRADQAISILEDLNNIYPTDNTTLYYLSEAYIKNKEYKKADQIREKLLEKNIQLEDKPDRTVWRRL